MAKEKWEIELKKEFFKRYKSISPAVLAMIWIDIEETLSQQKIEIKEMIEKKGKDFTRQADENVAIGSYNQAIKDILKQLK